MSTNQFDKKSQAWSALFSEPMSELVKRYTASVDFDQRLWKADIQGSLAHAEMLAAQNIIGADDRAAIERGMAQIATEIEAGRFEWKLDLEDVHLNIEARLTVVLGPASDPRVTAADMSVDDCSARILVRTYGSLYELRGTATATVLDLIASAFATMPVAVEPQGEAVAYAVDGRAYFTTSEGTDPTLSRVDD